MAIGSSASCATSAVAYHPRSPDKSILYEVVRDQLETSLAHGFLRVYCHACRHDRIVPFSCKVRAFCTDERSSTSACSLGMRMTRPGLSDPASSSRGIDVPLLR